MPSICSHAYHGNKAWEKMSAKSKQVKIRLDRVKDRLSLRVSKHPVWTGIGGERTGLKLGYRRNKAGGVWVTKARVMGKVEEATLAAADDRIDDDDTRPVVDGALTFSAACAAAETWRARLLVEYAAAASQQAAADEAARLEAGTVRQAVRDYLEKRGRENGAASAGNAKSRLTKHVLADAISDMAVETLTDADIRAWVSRVAQPKAKSKAQLDEVKTDDTKGLTPASIKRLMADFRAALVGCRAGLSGVTFVPPVIEDEAREHEYWSPAEIQQVIAAADAFGDDDLADMIVVLAVTGARFSQVARMRVSDVLTEQNVLLVPRARKGRQRKAKGSIRVPVEAEIITRLERITAGRKATDTLLMRWGFKQVRKPGAAGFTWQRDQREAWAAADQMEKGWRGAVRAAMPDLQDMPPPYQLRHCSIMRWLRTGLSVELTADLHDTSPEMLRKTYAKDAAGKAEDLLWQKMKGMGSLLSSAKVAPLRAVK
jgi:integrase